MPAHDELPYERIEVAKGEDWTRYIRIRGPERVQFTADAQAGATSISIRPDHPSLADDTKLIVGSNIILTLSAACAAGDTSLAVDAIVGPLKQGDYAQRLVDDLSGYTLTNGFEVLANAGDATPILTKTPTTTDDPEDPAVSGKSDVVVVTGAAADLANVEPGSYVWFVRRMNSGSVRTIANGEFVVVDRGFQ